MRHNLEIDRLRSIAALIVILAHIVYSYYPGVLNNFPGTGITIIDLFFVISGYVISCVLVSQVDTFKTDPARLIAALKIFAVKRMLRIYPLLYSGFMLVFVLSFFFRKSDLFSTPGNNLQAGLMILTSTYNFYFNDRFSSFALSPFWSFAIEEQFYLCFPFFLLLTKNNKQRTYIFIGALVALTFVIRPLTFYYYGGNSLFFTQTHLDAIIYGCLLYILSQQPWFESLKPIGQSFTWLRMFFVLLAIVVMLFVTTLNFTPSVYLSISCLLNFGLVLAGVLQCNIIAFPSVIQKTLDVLAPRSFSIYIVHFPVILLTNEIYTSFTSPSAFITAQKSCLAFVSILAVSEIFFQFVVKPSARAGRRLADNMREVSQLHVAANNSIPSNTLALSVPPNSP